MFQCSIRQNLLFVSRSTQNTQIPCDHYVEFFNVKLCGRVETESGGTRRRTRGEVKGKEANGVGSQQSSAWLGTVHPVLLQSFSLDPHWKKASTRLNRHPRRYDRTRPFRWKTESGFCVCAITFHFHSTTRKRKMEKGRTKGGYRNQRRKNATQKEKMLTHVS